MNPTLEEKIISTNQKYLKHFLHQELPQKLENQLEDFEWSYLDLISENEQKRRTFAPLGAMTLAQIEENKEALRASGLKALQNGKVGAILFGRRAGNTPWV